MDRAAQLQRRVPNARYSRVPVREASTAGALVSLLLAARSRAKASMGDEASASATGVAPEVLHLDIAHVIPACANRVLFELLLLGVLTSDVAGSPRVYHRRQTDTVLLEIANSVGNKTAQALSICRLLPTKRLQVGGAADMRLTRPVFTDAPACCRLRLEENSEMRGVCKMLRAYRAGRFKPDSGAFDPAYNVYEDNEITEAECFELMMHFACGGGGEGGAAAGSAGGGTAEGAGGATGAGAGNPEPSFAMFANFVLFMHRQFNLMSAYPLLSGYVLVRCFSASPCNHHPPPTCSLRPFDILVLFLILFPFRPPASCR